MMNMIYASIMNYPDIKRACAVPEGAAQALVC